MRFIVCQRRKFFADRHAFFFLKSQTGTAFPSQAKGTTPRGAGQVRSTLCFFLRLYSPLVGWPRF
jgi:hypothetical protein